MDLISTDVVIVGAGGAGIRAAIAAVEADPSLRVALLSKVYPMRSHTVAAEGGAAGVVKDNDSLDNHFHDTVSGGDWLCDQDAVESVRQRGTARARPDGALGLPVEPRAVRQGGGAAVRRYEDRAHVVRRRQDRLPHAAHALPDLAQISIDRTLRRILLPPTSWSRTGAAWASSRSRCARAVCVAFQAKAVVIATGGAGESSRSPPTARSRPATAWRWPIGPAFRSRTWSSSSTIRPGCPAPAS